MALTEQNHQLIAEHFAQRDLSDGIALDATCGNGHDTLFLSQLGFKQIFSFDIQQQAIDNTRQLMNESHINTVQLIKDGHENLDQYINQKVDCIMFNLGYLPNADKNITTQASSSLQALNLCLKLISKRGLISLLCYPGHQQGALETKAIQTWLNELDNNWVVKQVLASHPSQHAPILYLLHSH